MSTTGPVTRNTNALALGLAQVRVGKSIDNIASIAPVLTAENSIGSLTTVKFKASKDIFKHESGFPAMQDKTITLKTAASLEVAYEEITPFNVGLANGLASMSGEWATKLNSVVSGEVPLGRYQSPEDVRVEAFYTYPDGDHEMVYIFPRAQAGESFEMDHQKADTAKPPITFDAQRADSAVAVGNAVWDLMPLGRIIWRPL